MTELELYKFIKENNIEWHRADNEGTSDIIIFIYIFQLEGFYKIIKGYMDDDGGLAVRLLNGYVAVWMNDLCEHFDVDMNNVFTGQEP